MKKQFLLVSMFALSVKFSQMVGAATIYDLKLTGQLVPSSCDINIVGGNSYSLGDIPRSTLQDVGATILPYDMSKSLSISCTGATLVGVKSFDNRLGTSSSSQRQAHGLGVDPNGVKIGWYGLWFGATSADGAAVVSTASSDGGLSWQQAGSGFHNQGDNIISVAASFANRNPIPFTNASIDLMFRATIVDKSTLAATQMVTLDGSTTLELYYL